MGTVCDGELMGLRVTSSFLYNNQITSLPSSVFTDLSSLTYLFVMMMMSFIRVQNVFVIAWM